MAAKKIYASNLLPKKLAAKYMCLKSAVGSRKNKYAKYAYAAKKICNEQMVQMQPSFEEMHGETEVKQLFFNKGIVSIINQQCIEYLF